MNKAVIGILLLLISGLAGAFVYIRKLRAKSAESAEKLQAASSQVTSLQTSLKDKEDSAEREAQELRKQAAASSEKLKEEKKAKKAELMRIAAERKAEKARRDALEKLKDAKIAELSEKQKRHEAEIAKTEERRQAALKEADAARAKASAARSEADRAIANAKRSKQLADNAKRIADQRARRAGIEISRAKTQQSRAAKDVARAKAEVRGVNIKRTFEDAARYNAVPGYYRSGYKWAGNHFNVSDPNVCRSIAQKKRLAVWGHRNNLHPNKKYKNSCYFYHSGPKYAGNGNDRIHMIGCAFGGNPKTGCSAPKRMRVFGVRLGKGVKKVPQLLQNRQYGLLGGRNKKWCADENHRGRITCNRGGIGGWERFTVHNLGNNQVALKGGRNGKWCADEGNRVVCNRNGIGGWERFTVKNLGNNEFALKGGRNGKWCADEGGRIICNRGGIGAWERFKFQPVSAPPVKTARGRIGGRIVRLASGLTRVRDGRAKKAVSLAIAARAARRLATLNRRGNF